MKGKHLTLEERKIIASGIANERSCVAIAYEIGCDPTSVSKEVKRNRIDCSRSKFCSKEPCPNLKRFPFVCQNCKYKYTKCQYHQFKYDAKVAQIKADETLKSSRVGINLTKEETELLVTEIRNSLENNESIYQAVLKLPFEITVQTVYRYIRENLISVKSYELPYAISYKKRKSYKKEYEYNETKIDRSNRTFLDYIAFTKNSKLYTTQLDFLGSMKNDPNSILTLIIAEIHFTLIFLVNNKNSDKVIAIFDEIERKIGTEDFNAIFGLILTDRDPCFNDFERIETSCFGQGEARANIFYCDAYRSNEKASVENMNKQLRSYFPKKKRLDNMTPEKVRTINMALNSKKLRSLDGHSPEEAFIKLFGQETFNKLFN